MQSVEKVNSIVAEPVSDLNGEGPAPKGERAQSDNTLLLVQVVLCLLILAAVLIFQRISPELFSDLRQEYAWAIDQAVLIRDGGVDILYEE